MDEFICIHCDGHLMKIDEHYFCIQCGSKYKIIVENDVSELREVKIVRQPF